MFFRLVAAPNNMNTDVYGISNSDPSISDVSKYAPYFSLKHYSVGLLDIIFLKKNEVGPTLVEEESYVVEEWSFLQLRS